MSASESAVPTGAMSTGAEPMSALSTSITPEPTEEEAAAIAAAVSVTLFSGGAATEQVREPSRWRFSGRWWSRPVPLRRARPGR
ncbi:MAG: hypothetical protein R2735_07655 [Microthrixaceae bacterium]